MKKFIFLLFLILPTIVLGQVPIRFSEINTSNPEEKHFKELVSIKLLEADLKPSDFYVTKISDSFESIKLQLEHKDDFSQKYKNYRGNPSGKSQVCEYSKIEKELVSCLYFQ